MMVSLCRMIVIEIWPTRVLNLKKWLKNVYWCIHLLRIVLCHPTIHSADLDQHLTISYGCNQSKTNTRVYVNIFLILERKKLPIRNCNFSNRKSDPQCPYGKKCTYGNKCKFYHPERGMGPHKSVTERLSEHAARHLSARNSDSNGKVACTKSLSVPLSSNTTLDVCSDRRKPLGKWRHFSFVDFAAS